MAQDAAALLTVEGLSVTLPAGADRSLALDQVDLTVRRGEVVCLVGESGSGKSVLGNAVMGLLPDGGPRITAGRMVFDGQDLRALDRDAYRRLRGNRIGMIFQEPMSALNPVLRIGEQVEEIIAAHQTLDRRARHQRVVSLFAQVRLPDPEVIVQRYAHELSGGQRQRVMIAIALANEPDLLIADEPTTALDTTTQAEVLGLLHELQARMGLAVIFITHDIGVVAEIAHRVVVLQHGRIVEQGTRAKVLGAPVQPYTRRLIESVPRLAAAARPRQTATAVLRVNGLTKTYAPRRSGWWGGRAAVQPALRQVDLVLHRGETLALVGESGSGKSTLGRCVVGLSAWDSGSIHVHGRPLSTFAPGRAAQMVFQDPYASLNPRRRVGDIIAEPALVNGASHADGWARTRELLELVGLGPAAAQRYPHEFSGGQRQRVGLARALILRPDILVADEPVSALDVSVQAQVLGLLERIQRELGLSLLFITHDLRVAASIADRIAVMHRGQLVECGAASDVIARPASPYTRSLIEALPGREWERSRPALIPTRSAA